MYGTFVRSARESRSLTQRQLAEVSGVRQSNISAIESGRRVPSADTLNRLIVACGYELSATAGSRALFCPLPRAGWFPDDDLPPRAGDDPPDEPPALGRGASMEERVRAITAVLEAADATRRR
jgi:transcriptional regulator with XRE-family HTH domain